METTSKPGDNFPQMLVRFTPDGVFVEGKDFPSVDLMIGSLLDVVSTLVGGDKQPKHQPVHMRDE